MTEDVHNFQERLESTLDNILQKKWWTMCDKKTDQDSCPNCDSSDLKHLVQELRTGGRFQPISGAQRHELQETVPVTDLLKEDLRIQQLPP